MSQIFEYARDVVKASGAELESGSLFAKLLTHNDDSGRHGVCIPADAYSFFPFFEILDPNQNQTIEFQAVDVSTNQLKAIGYKYYERYPERRLTRLNPVLNDRTSEARLLVVIHAKHMDGSSAYYYEAVSGVNAAHLNALLSVIFGADVQRKQGAFVVTPVKSGAFKMDSDLSDLVAKFDEVKELGYIDSLRSGHTGIGYTFETLLGIKENNDKTADFKGIEIKCKGVKEGKQRSTGKVNLFQQGPTWVDGLSAQQRIKMIGKKEGSGLYTCFSQVTTIENNLGLIMGVLNDGGRIELSKKQQDVGYWPFKVLAKRLAEKHSRSAFIKARSKATKSGTKYWYEELVYCDQPSIERFISLVTARNIVFEFTMSERPDGSVRNHGYPWRLNNTELLDQLFAFQIKLR